MLLYHNQGQESARRWRAIVIPDVRVIRVGAKRRSAFRNYLSRHLDSAFRLLGTFQSRRVRLATTKS